MAYFKCMNTEGSLITWIFDTKMFQAFAKPVERNFELMYYPGASWDDNGLFLDFQFWPIIDPSPLYNIDVFYDGP